MIDTAKLLSIFKPCGAGQEQGVTAIVGEFERRKMTDMRDLSYMLATAYWETDKTMQPIEEYGKGRGRAYGAPDPRTGLVYFGRGLVQLTWYDNYLKMGRALGIDLVRNPELALQMGWAVQIMFEGMIHGMFTGVRLHDYFNSNRTDFYNARRIINGIDCAAEIESIARRFYSALGGPSYQRILMRGMRGDDVKEVQQALVRAGYSIGPAGADGDFGRATETAVVEFQRDHGLDVDGEVGNDTRKGLKIA